RYPISLLTVGIGWTHLLDVPRNSVTYADRVLPIRRVALVSRVAGSAGARRVGATRLGGARTGSARTAFAADRHMQASSASSHHGPAIRAGANGRGLRRRSTVDMLVEGYFGEDAAIRRIACESVLMLGGPRALLMQAAHPLVAAGIVDHSRFRQDPWRRLARTMAALYTI